MNSKKMARILLVAALGAAVAAAGGTGSIALADNPDSFPLTVGHGGDPFVTPCEHSSVGKGFCMYTSQDIDTGTGDNKFVMDNTRGFFSKDGITWQDKGVMLTEKQYDWVPHPPDAPEQKHLWAPAMGQTNGRGGVRYYLYVPDVYAGPDGKPNVHMYGSIGVSVAEAPFGPFTPIGRVTQLDPYMSDPEPFPRGWDLTTTQGVRYMLWADQDGPTCGTLAIGAFQPDSMVDLVGTHNQIEINGIKDGPYKNGQRKDGLGTCTVTYETPGNKNGTVHPHPYMEGPTLHSLPDDFPGLAGKIWHTDASGNRVDMKYMLVFPAKPDNVPAECSSSLGQTNSTNQVIAYALSNEVTGPYEYQGILMCGSTSEWTNHHYVAEVKTPTGSSRTILYYHDGPTGGPKRRPHAECLTPWNGKFVTADHTTTDGLDWCTTSSPIVAFYSRSSQRTIYVQGDGTMTGNGLRMGADDQFTLVNLGNDTWALQARKTRKYVTAGGDQMLYANVDAIRSDAEKFKFEKRTSNGQDYFLIRSVKYNKLVANEMNDGNKLKARTDPNQPGAWEEFELRSLYEN